MRCPRCATADLDPTPHDEAGMVTCQCGHRAYAGYIAEADSLAARSAWLADRVAAGDPEPAPEVQRAYAIWSPPGVVAPGTGPSGLVPPGTIPHPGHVALPAPAPRGAPSAQTLLLGIGALLLVIAGAVFAAVVWDRLGAFGQVALMLGATAGVGALAIRLRRRLEGTAEALAVVAAGLAAVDLMAAPMLGLLPERWVTDPTLYPAVAFAGLGAAMLLLHRRFGLRAWSWLGWAATDGRSRLRGRRGRQRDGLRGLDRGRDRGTRTGQHRDAGGLGASRPGAIPGGRAQDRGRIRPAPERGSRLPRRRWSATPCRVRWSPRPPRRWPSASGPRSTADRDRGRTVQVAAAALSGITVALLLALPEEPQPVWLAAVVAVAGLTVGMVIWVLRPDRTVALVGACAVWIPWAATRMDAESGHARRRPRGQPAVAAGPARGRRDGVRGRVVASRQQGGSAPCSAPRPRCSRRRRGPTPSRPTPWCSPPSCCWRACCGGAAVRPRRCSGSALPSRWR